MFVFLFVSLIRRPRRKNQLQKRGSHIRPSCLRQWSRPPPWNLHWKLMKFGYNEIEASFSEFKEVQHNPVHAYLALSPTVFSRVLSQVNVDLDFSGHLQLNNSCSNIVLCHLKSCLSTKVASQIHISQISLQTIFRLFTFCFNFVLRKTKLIGEIFCHRFTTYNTTWLI